MTMHGTFWQFPADVLRRELRRHRAALDLSESRRRLLRAGTTGSCFGCDDTAKSEFLNKRKVKGELAGAGQSQSNLWFVEPEQLDQLGPAHRPRRGVAG